MSWQTEEVMELRFLIDDFLAPQVYTDTQLQQLLVLAGKQAQQDMQFINRYSFDILGITITPDPTDPNNADPDFTIISCMKAACILARSKLLSQQGGLLVTDTVSEIDTRGRTQALALAQSNICKAYTDLKLQYVCGSQVGRSILSPFRVGYYTNGQFLGLRRGVSQYLGFLP